TFLCIEVTPKKGEKTLSVGELLPPLRVRFETEYPYYPLRYSSQQGDFNLALFTLTEEPIDLEKSAGVLEAIGWQNQPGKAVDFADATWKGPQTIHADDLLQGDTALKSLPKQSKMLLGQVFLHEVETNRFSFGLFVGKPNPKDRPISDWDGDCFFTLKDQKIAPLATGKAKAEED
ncbi:MAG: hypothetical protein AB8C95_07860, partial [Phycisphaeraceae bacterium]